MQALQPGSDSAPAQDSRGEPANHRWRIKRCSVSQCIPDVERRGTALTSHFAKNFVPPWHSVSRAI